MCSAGFVKERRLSVGSCAAYKARANASHSLVPPKSFDDAETEVASEFWASLRRPLGRWVRASGWKVRSAMNCRIFESSDVSLNVCYTCYFCLMPTFCRLQSGALNLSMSRHFFSSHASVSSPLGPSHVFRRTAICVLSLRFEMGVLRRYSRVEKSGDEGRDGRERIKIGFLPPFKLFSPSVLTVSDQIAAVPSEEENVECPIADSHCEQKKLISCPAPRIAISARDASAQKANPGSDAALSWREIEQSMVSTRSVDAMAAMAIGSTSLSPDEGSR